MLETSKKFTWTGIGAILLGLLIYVLFSFWQFVNTPILSPGKPALEFVYTKGTSSYKLSRHLAKQGIISNSYYFYILGHLNGNMRFLQAGQYEVTPGMKPGDILARMVRGEVNMQTFTIVEGWTFQQMLKALQSNTYVTHTISNLSDDAIMQAIGYPGDRPEGRFAPDTYLFHTGIKDVVLLHMAFELMEKRVQEAWDKRDLSIPFHCTYDALIAASIIEKETALAKERPVIAGVLVRRLAKNMPLGMDPTVFYGLFQDYSVNHKLTHEDLLKNTPYNTYMHRGLPPTPICMPGKDSIEAALHPAPGDVLYYVSKGDGSHHFSKTLEEQDNAIRKYQKK